MGDQTLEHAKEQLRLRHMEWEDLPAFLDLVDALADYEQLPRPDANARQRLARDAFADPSLFHVLLAERADRVIAYAIWFLTYSSFLARPTLYLEDIFVLESERRRGVAEAVMRALAREAGERGCGRMEWSVLTWNTPAIALYERIGATRLEEWRTYRLTGEPLEQLAR